MRPRSPRRRRRPPARPVAASLPLLLGLLLPAAAPAFPPGHFLVTSSFPLDISGGSVTQFSAEGERLVSFGVYQLLNPGKMAVDNEGNLLVADSFSGNLKRFDPSGNLAGTLGDGHLVTASCVAVGPDDRVYVGDRIRGEVRVFSPSGEDLGAFGGEILLDAADVKTSASGRILVADSMAGSVRIFSPDHELVASIQRTSPAAMAVGADDLVYLPGQDTIDRYDLDGDPVDSIPLGDARVVSGIDVDAEGNVAMLDFLEGVVRVVGPDGALRLEFGGDLYRYADGVLILP